MTKALLPKIYSRCVSNAPQHCLQNQDSQLQFILLHICSHKQFFKSSFHHYC